MTSISMQEGDEFVPIEGIANIRPFARDEHQALAEYLCHEVADRWNDYQARVYGGRILPPHVRLTGFGR